MVFYMLAWQFDFAAECLKFSGQSELKWFLFTCFALFLYLPIFWFWWVSIFCFTVSDLFAMSIKLIADIDTSCRPPENIPWSSLHLHCSVKTRTESFTLQLPVPGVDAEIPVGTMEGVGRVRATKEWQSPALYYTLHNLNCTTHSIIL